MYLTAQYVDHLANMGNEPGQHKGLVTIMLAFPVEGKKELTVSSGSVTKAVEGGSTVEYQITLPDGRRLTLEPTSVIGVIDAKKKDDE